MYIYVGVASSLHFDQCLSLADITRVFIPFPLLARLAVVVLFCRLASCNLFKSWRLCFNRLPSLSSPSHSFQDASLHQPSAFRFSCSRNSPSPPCRYRHRQRSCLLHLQSQRRKPHQGRLHLHLLQRVCGQLPAHESMGKLQRAMGLPGQKRSEPYRRHQPGNPSHAAGRCDCRPGSPGRPKGHSRSHFTRE